MHIIMPISVKPSHTHSVPIVEPLVQKLCEVEGIENRPRLVRGFISNAV